MTNKANKDTKWHYFSGTLEYYNNKTTNDYGAYSLCMKLDDIDEYNKTGIQVTVGEDNTVWFRRPKVKLMKGELVELGSPITLDNQESPQPLNTLIGKGSRIVAKVKSYPTQKGTGHTLEAVKVIDLVKVEGSGEYNF